MLPLYSCWEFKGGRSDRGRCMGGNVNFLKELTHKNIISLLVLTSFCLAINQMAHFPIFDQFMKGIASQTIEGFLSQWNCCI